MTLKVRDIEYFAVVAQHGNVGRAAEALGLSQPALSKSLRRLEKSKQAKLVNPTSKGIGVTPVGSAAAYRHRPEFRHPLGACRLRCVVERRVKSDAEGHRPGSRCFDISLASR